VKNTVIVGAKDYTQNLKAGTRKKPAVVSKYLHFLPLGNGKGVRTRKIKEVGAGDFVLTRRCSCSIDSGRSWGGERKVSPSIARFGRMSPKRERDQETTQPMKGGKRTDRWVESSGP